MFNVHHIDPSYPPRISYYSDGPDTSGLPSLWDEPTANTVKVAVFRMDDGTVCITSDEDAVDLAENYQ